MSMNTLPNILPNASSSVGGDTAPANAGNSAEPVVDSAADLFGILFGEALPGAVARPGSDSADSGPGSEPMVDDAPIFLPLLPQAGGEASHGELITRESLSRASTQLHLQASPPLMNTDDIANARSALAATGLTGADTGANEKPGQIGFGGMQREAEQHRLEWVQQVLQQRSSETAQATPGRGMSGETSGASDSSLPGALAALTAGEGSSMSGSSIGMSRSQGPIQLQQPGVAQDIGNRVVWMQRDGVDRARVDVAPRELGPIELEIDIRDGRAELNLAASRAETRELLQQALPKLQQLLAQQGIELDQANVRDGDEADRQPQESTHSGGRDASTDDEDLADINPVSRHDGLIDRYA